MDRTPEELARLRLEQEFGTHANTVLHAGAIPPEYMLQLRLQEVVPSTPRRPADISDVERHLHALYFCGRG